MSEHATGRSRIPWGPILMIGCGLLFAGGMLAAMHNVSQTEDPITNGTTPMPRAAYESRDLWNDAKHPHKLQDDEPNPNLRKY